MTSNRVRIGTLWRSGRDHITLERLTNSADQEPVRVTRVDVRLGLVAEDGLNGQVVIAVGPNAHFSNFLAVDEPV